MSEVKQKKTRSFPYYETYEKRFQTFKNWPGIANPRLLARAGFFSTDTADHVRCFSCGVGIKCWDSSCDPWTEHLRWRPKCEYLKTGYSAYNKEKLRVGYSSFEERLMSFTASWPGTESQDPVQMANAGFFYIGYGDHVQCYCCNIHVHSWEAQDIPIQEHARWKPNCGHLRERLLLESKREKAS
ncbi:baculoviral IAP repeat-containing protein 7-A-like [Saccostrea echinata]|uniref:baculoviral IAP repeat-containing protein 7-A-like n=1 Tax=Saccostrea echinata TaxID=191078 RepID=UPI002A826D7B|nr:baculoviral IAP repeat-containing protein 7-A-like [Saccostrea echinata]